MEYWQPRFGSGGKGWLERWQSWAGICNQRLGASEQDKQLAYQALFHSHLDKGTLDQIREATKKAWVLGGEHFKAEIENLLERRARPLPKAGDRRSEAVV